MLFFVYFILLFLASSLYLTDTLNSIGSITISIMVLMIIPIVLMVRKYDFKIPVYSLILMFCFLLICTVSALINNDVKLILNAGMIVMLYIAGYIIIPSFNIRGNEIIYKSVMLSHIPLIVAPLISGINTDPYQGIFYNPNSFGSVVATLFALILAVFLFKLESYYTSETKQKFGSLLLYFLVLFLCFFLIVMSSSRTSLLSATFMLGPGVFIVFVRLIKNKKLMPFVKSIFFGGVGIAFLVLVAKITSFYDYFYNNIIYKFQIKSGNVLDDRGLVWNQTIREAGLFGNGSDYFTTQTIAAAHNTFISILGEYGWLTLSLFVLFLIYGAYTSMKYAISGVNDKYKYMPIMLLVCFVTLSFGESMLFKLSMLALFFSLGTTVNVKRRIVEFKEKEPKKQRKLKRYKLTW